MGGILKPILRHFILGRILFALFLFGTLFTIARAELEEAPHHYSTPFSELMTYRQFRDLAHKLSLKVNLFEEVWKQDPKAEFMGGTSRDFLYWVRGQFKECRNRNEANAVMTQLLLRDRIDVKEFIGGESDVDVISEKEIDFRARSYGVKKVDGIDLDRLVPDTNKGRDEIKQGHIPVEKMRISMEGLTPWKGFGDGAREIYQNRLTIHFSSDRDFGSTEFARLKINHPVLLALRFLRQQAQNYFQTRGNVYPGPEIFDIDPGIEELVRLAIDRAASGGELTPYLAVSSFRRWINETIQKAFRSYTNPTAAKLLFDHFGADRLVKKYKEIEPYNQFVFVQPREPKLIKQFFKQYHVNEKSFYLPVKEFLPDLTLYHGTQTPANYRAILFQGVLPSTEDKLAGAGLYGVGKPHISFARDWAKSADRVVMFQVDPDARLVDISTDEGLRVWTEYQLKNPESSYEDFARDFGIDIIKYKYKVPAYTVKNASVLSKPEGYRLKLLPYSVLHEKAMQVRSAEDLRKFVFLVRQNGVDPTEWAMLAEAIMERNPTPIMALRFMDLMNSERTSENIADEDGAREYLIKFLNQKRIIDPNEQRAIERFIALRLKNLRGLEGHGIIPLMGTRCLMENPNWKSWMNTILENRGRNFHIDRALAKYVLGQPAVLELEEWESWFQKIWKGKRAIPEMAQHVLLTDKVRSHDKWEGWISELLNSRFMASDFARLILSDPAVIKNPKWPDWVKIALAKPYLHVFEEILATKAAVRHPRWMELMKAAGKRLGDKQVPLSDQRFRAREIAKILCSPFISREKWETLMEHYLFKLDDEIHISLLDKRAITHPKWKTWVQKLIRENRFGWAVTSVIMHPSVVAQRKDWKDFFIDISKKGNSLALDWLAAHFQELGARIISQPYFERVMDLLVNNSKQLFMLGYCLYKNPWIKQHPKWPEWVSIFVERAVTENQDKNSNKNRFESVRFLSGIRAIGEEMNLEQHPDGERLMDLVVTKVRHNKDYLQGLLDSLYRDHPRVKIWKEALSLTMEKSRVRYLREHPITVVDESCQKPLGRL